MHDSVSNDDKHHQYLDEHDRLANLFVTNRFAFEQERKRILRAAINTMEHPENRKEQQNELDRILKGIGSSENRLAMIQALFWHHLFNNWQPELHEQVGHLNALVNTIRTRPVLTLVK